MSVRAKKPLGQHFLNDENIARKIAESLSFKDCNEILEIGPGMGVLTKYLIDKGKDLSVVELDRESVAYLLEHYPLLKGNILHGDLK